MNNFIEFLKVNFTVCLHNVIKMILCMHVDDTHWRRGFPVYVLAGRLLLNRDCLYGSLEQYNTE